MKKLLLSLIILLAFVTGSQAQDVSVSLIKNYINGKTTWDTYFIYDVVHSRLMYSFSENSYTIDVNVKKNFLFLNFKVGLSNYGNIHLEKSNLKEAQDRDWVGDYLIHVI